MAFIPIYIRSLRGLPTGAANRYPDKCDANPDEARKINVEASKHLARATSSRNILLIYISTGPYFPQTN